MFLRNIFQVNNLQQLPKTSIFLGSISCFSQNLKIIIQIISVSILHQEKFRNEKNHEENRRLAEVVIYLYCDKNLCFIISWTVFSVFLLQVSRTLPDYFQYFSIFSILRLECRRERKTLSRWDWEIIGNCYDGLYQVSRTLWCSMKLLQRWDGNTANIKDIKKH